MVITRQSVKIVVAMHTYPWTSRGSHMEPEQGMTDLADLNTGVDTISLSGVT